MELFNEIKQSIGNELIDCECPYCHQTVTVSLNENGDTVTCPYCKKEMPLTIEGLDDTMEEIQNSLNSVDDAFNEIEKTLSGK